MTRHKLAPAPTDARQMKGASVVVLLEADLVFRIGLVEYGAICINILIATAIFKRQGPKTKVTKHRKLWKMEEWAKNSSSGPGCASSGAQC